MAKLVGLAVLFAAGLALAGGLASVGVADITTTETLPVTTTVEATTTAPAQTVLTTVEHTTTEAATVPTTATTNGTSSTEKTPTWVWIVLAILAAAVIGLVAALLAGRGMSEPERARRLDAAVATWTTQGWALESQRPGEAILRRGPEVMAVGIDAKGQISTRPLSG
jgi:beta-lactamase regulating signal transducer with metallopeptidase domain